jgi:hypothetical protein
MIGVESTEMSNKTNAKNNNIESGVAGRSILATWSLPLRNDRGCQRRQDAAFRGVVGSILGGM